MKAAGHWALPRRGRGARGLCLPPSHTSPWTESRTPPRRPGPPPNSHARPRVERARRAGPGPGSPPGSPGTAGSGRQPPRGRGWVLRLSAAAIGIAGRSAAGAGPAVPPAGRAPPHPGRSGPAGAPRCRATRTAAGAAGPEPGRAGLRKAPCACTGSALPPASPLGAAYFRFTKIKSSVRKWR